MKGQKLTPSPCASLIGCLALLSGCSGDLPAISFIEKLRVLAVKAEPPEIAPNESAMLDALVAEPITAPSLDGVSYLWLACPAPPGVTTERPCGLASGPMPTLPPDCKGIPSDHLCFLSTSATASATPDASLLGSDGSGTLIVTFVAADRLTATDCWQSVAANGGLPTDPDHCVIALKRLTVSDPGRQIASGGEPPAPNRNPGLVAFGMQDEKSSAPPLSLLDGNATVPHSPPSGPKTRRELIMTRADDASEVKADGSYEILSVSWYTDDGTLDGARSTFRSDECPTQLDCAKRPPPSITTNGWTAPVQEGSARFWVVLRDDRGGVDWLQGALLTLP